MKYRHLVVGLTVLAVLVGCSSNNPVAPTHTTTAKWRLQVTGERIYGVWGSSGRDVFAVGEAGTILHYNGSEWNPMTSGTAQTLLGVWGSCGSDVFAVGQFGTILHYSR